MQLVGDENIKVRLNQLKGNEDYGNMLEADKGMKVLEHESDGDMKAIGAQRSWEPDSDEEVKLWRLMVTWMRWGIRIRGNISWEHKVGEKLKVMGHEGTESNMSNSWFEVVGDVGRVHDYLHWGCFLDSVINYAAAQVDFLIIPSRWGKIIAVVIVINWYSLCLLAIQIRLLIYWHLTCEYVTHATPGFI